MDEELVDKVWDSIDEEEYKNCVKRDYKYVCLRLKTLFEEDNRDDDDLTRALLDRKSFYETYFGLKNLKF